MEPSEHLDLDLAASALRADAVDVQTLVEVLARKLEAALPDGTSVTRRGRRFSKEKPVARLAVSLAGVDYSLTVQDGGVRPLRSRAVRGVTIKSEELQLDSWLEALLAALAEQAERSQTARTALEALLG